ncbi:MAG: TonB-dependent receptor, partial [Rhodospirillales bacterium]|nr:TonB-dependent receptor [Rhodospirillales bacterium]
EAINLRFGVNDYEHVELEGDEIGTRFENDAWEGRLEFMHAPWGEWDGAYGVQVGHRQFSAVGAEAFVPPVDTSTYGAFIVEQRDVEDWHVSLGARLEYQQQDPSGDLPTVNDTATSFSLAAVRDLPDGNSFIANAALAQRLPVAEELYADGPHLATQTVEIGNPDIGVETSRHLDIGLRSSGGGTSWSLTAFVTSYADFIYLEETGEIDHGLPVYHFEQNDADFSGIEAEFFSPIFVRGESELDIRVFADYVNGELGNGENVPRMPPLRYGSRIQYHNEQVLFGLEVTQYDDQTNTAHHETPTAGYTMINADVNWTITTPGGTAFEVFVIGTNLADEDARKHTSFVKNSLPLPGRNISAGFRTHF